MISNSLTLLGGYIELAAYRGPRNSTMVTATGNRFRATGMTVRNPADKRNGQLGLDVATARALRAMADLLDRETGINTR